MLPQFSKKSNKALNKGLVVFNVGWFDFFSLRLHELRLNLVGILFNSTESLISKIFIIDLFKVSKGKISKLFFILNPQQKPHLKFV